MFRILRERRRLCNLEVNKYGGAHCERREQHARERAPDEVQKHVFPRAPNYEAVAGPTERVEGEGPAGTKGVIAREPTALYMQCMDAHGSDEKVALRPRFSSFSRELREVSRHVPCGAS